MDYRDPKLTLVLLDALVERGLTQEMFKRLHHAGRTASIGAHRSYCKDVRKFLEDERNAEATHRLALCFDFHMAGESWESAIQKTLDQIPLAVPREFLPTADEAV